jgi:hypothetical protein
LHRLEKAEKAIAAICTATTVVARAGLLGGRKHTSNSLSYLSKMVPEYSDSANYVASLATKDRHIITASGLGAIEFAMEIFKELNIVSPEMMAMWFDAFKHGKYPEEIFAGWEPVQAKVGKDEMKNIPYGAVAMYGFADKLACGLQQLMAGARKFNLSEISRDDLVSANRETEEVTKIPFMTEAQEDSALKILKS